MDVVKEMQNDSMLINVRLFVVMDEFQQYKKASQISNEQFKKSLKKVICQEVYHHKGTECSENESLKID